MKNIKEIIKDETGNSKDIIIKSIYIKNEEILIIFNEVLSSSDYINNYILKSMTNLDLNKIENISFFLKNNIPSNNIIEIDNPKDIYNYLFNGFTIINYQDLYLAIESRANLDRGVSEATTENSIIGSKDSFSENFNTNLGLIRRRIKTKDLWVKETLIGTKTITKVGVVYIKSIAKKDLVDNIFKKLDQINIDGIIDSTYIKELLTIEKESLFPTIMTTERPDLTSMALLEGKIIILVDNSPFVLILPTFLIDYFHTSDDYYQKDKNTSLIRIIRFLAFFISLFIPAIYIASTTHNHDLLSLPLLINIASQRASVPMSALIEALLMMLIFEILRESDLRMPSTIGTSISILGGLILGEAAVSAGIVSPIMIIVIALSSISSLIFSSIEMVSAIRYWRIILILLAAFLGLFGVFTGLLLLLIELTSIKTLGLSYMSPITPFIEKEQSDSILKKNKLGPKFRNPLLTKNKIRGVIK